MTRAVVTSRMFTAQFLHALRADVAGTAQRGCSQTGPAVVAAWRINPRIPAMPWDSPPPRTPRLPATAGVQLPQHAMPRSPHRPRSPETRGNAARRRCAAVRAELASSRLLWKTLLEPSSKFEHVVTAETGNPATAPPSCLRARGKPRRGLFRICQRPRREYSSIVVADLTFGTRQIPWS
jgi:hypothetical protein